jgi:hypothetical protein
MIFDAKLSTPNAGYFPLCTFTPVVVYSSETGTPRPVYAGMLAVGASGEEYFYPSWVAA